MIKYGKTPQFSNVIKAVRESHDYHGKDENGNPIREHRTPYPTLKFEASVKVHGTNAGIVFKADGTTDFQSRERVLTLEYDNMGFMQAMVSKDLSFMTKYIFDETLVVYGEWFGGSIQRGVAVSNLTAKKFMIFQVLADGKPVPFKSIKDHDQGIYNIYDFPISEFEIDFNNPILSQQGIVDLTLAVEEQCPVGKFFGFDGVGEGIVLRSVDDPTIMFKSKGEKHSSSKVTKLASVDPEKVKNVKEFVDYAVTENRLNQGLEHFTLENKNIGSYLQWVVRDVVNEEIDTLNNSQLEVKDVSKQISLKAREFFFAKMAEANGL